MMAVKEISNCYANQERLENITIDSVDINRVVMGCSEQFYTHKLHTLKEINPFLEKCSLPKMQFIISVALTVKN